MTVIERELSKELKKYEKRIKQVASHFIFNVDDRLECEQYLRIQLCKLCKFRHKYKYNGNKNDWDFVVKSMLKRRASDYRNRMLKNNSRFLTANRLQDDNGENYNIENTDEFVPHHSDSIQTFITDLAHIVDACDEFNDFDRRYMRALLDYEGKNFAPNKIKSRLKLSKQEREKYQELVEEFLIKIRLHRSKM